MIKVLVVDDSKFIRALLSEMIAQAEDLCVVGEAADPYEARDKIKALEPDVITLDIEMPRMNGIAFLRNLMRLHPLPVVMVSTLTAKGAPITLAALDLGAVDYLEKPKTKVSEALPHYTETLQEKIRIAAGANVQGKQRNVISNSNRQSLVDASWRALQFNSERLVAIGASTGGTEAIKEVIVNLPPHFPPIVVTQHIPPVFSTSYAQRLDKLANMRVVEAQHKQAIMPGHVYIAPGDHHLLVKRQGKQRICWLTQSEPVNRHRPSVDVMFDSIDKAEAKVCTALILTGMGVDGAQGLLGLRQKGAYTLAQDEATSVIYGMPKAAAELQAVEKQLALQDIPKALIQSSVIATRRSR